MSNNELAEELHKQIIRKINKRKVHSSFIDNIWGADLANMWLINKFIKEVCFFVMCYWYFNKHPWVIPLEDKKGITVANAFQKMLKKSNRKPNKIRVDKGSDFCNRSMKSLWENNSIEMYSTHNKGISIVTERFIRTLNNKNQCFYW